MLTSSERRSLALTIAFLALGAGLKTWQRAQARLGPFPESGPGSGSRAAPTPSLVAEPSRMEPVASQGPDSLYSGTPDAPLPVPAERALPDQAMPGRALPDPGFPDPGFKAASEARADPASLAYSIDLGGPSHRQESRLRKPGVAGTHSSARKAPPAPTSLNRASLAELAQLPGIGVKTAQAIVDYRKTHGPFLDIRELLHVKGIGEKKLAQLAPFLVIAPEREEEPMKQVMGTGPE